MLIGCVALLLGGVATFNLAIDPFRAYRLGLMEDLDRHKIEVGRVMKAEMIRSNGAATVVLGSSRIVRSIDTEHPAWDDRPVVNAGNGGANASEIVQGVRLALEQPETERLVVFVDFHMCGSRQGPEHDFKQSAFNPDLSWPARHAILLSSSISTRNQGCEWLGGRPGDSYALSGRRLGAIGFPGESRGTADVVGEADAS